MTVPQQTLERSAEARARDDRAALTRIAIVGFTTIVIREFNRIIRIWGQTIVPPAITATLYFVIFGSLIGSRIGDMGGYTYIQYIAPGLIMMSVITNSYGNVVSSFFGAKFGKHIEELLVSPLPNSLIVTGYMVGGIVRGLIVGGVVTTITLIFTHLQVHSVPIVISAVLLSSIVFALAGMINAVFAKNFDQISFIPTFVLTPLTYLGGVFYTIKLLPEWAQGMSYANPILYMVNAFRYGFLGVSDVDIRFAYTMMIGAAVALFTSLRVAAAAGRRNPGMTGLVAGLSGRAFSPTLVSVRLQPDSSSRDRLVDRIEVIPSLEPPVAVEIELGAHRLSAAKRHSLDHPLRSAVQVFGLERNAVLIQAAHVGLPVAVLVGLPLYGLSVAKVRAALEVAVEIVVAAILRRVAVPVVFEDQVDAPIEVAIRFDAA